MKISEKVSLKELTTFKAGGFARFFCVAQNLDDLKSAEEFALEKGLAILILGGGSNLLIDDRGFDGLVIKVAFRGCEFKSVKNGQVEVIVGAGENWDEFVAVTIGKNLSGLENLSGIPGTVGATPVQNVGAYGVEVKDLISWVEAVDLDNGTVKKFSNEECQFGYRDSFFKTLAGKKFVVTKVSYLLNQEFKPNLAYKDLQVYFGNTQKSPSLLDVRTAVLKIRAGKFPELNKIGTAGSFFKNPIVSQEKFNELKIKYPDLPGFPVQSNVNGQVSNVKISLAYILDKVCNLKGFRDGKVGLFENQPLVLINYGGADSSEIKKFSEIIKTKVFELTGIKIEEEVQTI